MWLLCLLFASSVSALAIGAGYLSRRALSLLPALCGCLAFSTSAIAVDLLVLWDPNPPLQAVTGYNVYWQTGTNWTRIGGSPTNGFRWVSAPAGFNYIAVTATNTTGESVKTAPVMAPYVPEPLTAPTNVTVRFAVP